MCRGGGGQNPLVIVQGTHLRFFHPTPAYCGLCPRYCTRQQWLQHWLSHNHLAVRSAAAKLLALSALPPPHPHPACLLLCPRYLTRQQWLQHWLSHNHLPVRAAAAQLLALSATCLDTAAAEALLQVLLGSFPAVGGGSSSSNSKLLEEQEGSMLAVGESGS